MVDSALLDALKGLISALHLFARAATNRMLGISRSLDANFKAIGASVHLSSIAVLDKQTSIFIGDGADVVFSDHHLGVCDSIGLASARNRCQISVLVVFVACSLAFIVCNNPFHVSFRKASHDTIWVQNFRVTVMHLADHYTISCDEAVGLGFAILTSTIKLCVMDLTDLSRAKKLDNETILKGECGN